MTSLFVLFNIWYKVYYISTHVQIYDLCWKVIKSERTGRLNFWLSKLNKRTWTVKFLIYIILHIYIQRRLSHQQSWILFCFVFNQGQKGTEIYPWRKETWKTTFLWSLSSLQYGGEPQLLLRSTNLLKLRLKGLNFLTWQRVHFLMKVVWWCSTVLKSVRKLIGNHTRYFLNLFNVFGNYIYILNFVKIKGFEV